MQTNSYISAAALAAALLAAPQPALAQGLGLNLNLGGLLDVDANVGIGGSNLVDVDAGVSVGGGNVVDVNAGAAVGGGSLVDVGAGVNVGGTGGLNVGANVAVGNSNAGVDNSIVDPVDGIPRHSGLLDANLNIGAPAGGGSGALGPNGGNLINLNVGGTDQALVDANVDVISGGNSGALINGDIRIGTLGGGEERKDALLGLIESPHLADIDLDAAIDDRRVAIIAAADLLNEDALVDIRAAIGLGGVGRGELLDALTGSLTLGTILGKNGIDLEDVLAVQVGENGATEVIVLDGTVKLALLGGGGNLVDLTVDELANLDLDLLTDNELAALDLSLLPEELAAAVKLRLLDIDDDGRLGSVANLQIALGGGVDGGGTGTPGGGTGTPGGGTGTPGGGTGTPGGGTGTPGGGTGTPGGGTGTPGGGTGTPGGGTGTPGGGTGTPGGGTGTPGGGTGTPGGGTGVGGGTTPGGSGGNAGMINGPVIAPIDGGFGIASLGCDVGVLALATGLDATPQSIAAATSLELVRIEGCQRVLVDGAAESIRAAIAANRAISGVLDDAQIPLDTVIGATIQGGTLTLFIEPIVS